ncbi:unnamed protein product [Sphagnum balticum]
MSDSYTASLRLDQPQVGGDSGTWGGTINTDLTLLDSAITGIAVVSLTGLTTYTLTANNGATDQARCMLYQFTGTPTSLCTVTLPSCVKVGFAQNLSSQNVILTTGSGTTARVNTSSFIFFVCDGTNVTAPAPYYNSDIYCTGTIYGTELFITSVGSTSLYSSGGVTLGGIPTSSSGLSSGQVWRNGNTLMIGMPQGPMAGMSQGQMAAPQQQMSPQMMQALMAMHAQQQQGGGMQGMQGQPMPQQPHPGMQMPQMPPQGMPQQQPQPPPHLMGHAQQMQPQTPMLSQGIPSVPHPSGNSPGPGSMQSPGSQTQRSVPIQNPNLAMFGRAASANPNTPPDPSKLKLTSAEWAQLGRFGDTIIAHLTPGEIAVPPQVQTPQLMRELDKAFRRAKVSVPQFTAGSPKSSTNPKSGLPEYNWLASVLPLLAAGGLAATGVGLGADALGLGADAAATGATAGADSGAGLLGSDLTGSLTGASATGAGLGDTSSLAGVGGLTAGAGSATAPIDATATGLGGAGAGAGSSIMGANGQLAPGLVMSGDSGVVLHRLHLH